MCQRMGITLGIAAVSTDCLPFVNYVYDSFRK